MDKARVFKKGNINIFRVDKIVNLKIENYIDPEYILDNKSGGFLTETGYLAVFSLQSLNNKDLPVFIARWDENKETLDVDIKNVSKEVENDFKNGVNGYLGHHPERVDLSSRTYKVFIKIPDRDVFIGSVTFNINHGHEPDIVC